MVHGVWQDNDLTKFFSRLVLPEGVRVYPYFPLYSKYKTVCAQAPFPGPEFRKRVLPLLHRAIAFLAPRMDEIQQSLKGQAGDDKLMAAVDLSPVGFSETMPTFVDLRGKVPAAWREVFRGLSARAYLDSRDMKEYALDISPGQA